MRLSECSPFRHENPLSQHVNGQALTPHFTATPSEPWRTVPYSTPQHTTAPHSSPQYIPAIHSTVDHRTPHSSPSVCNLEHHVHDETSCVPSPFIWYESARVLQAKRTCCLRQPDALICTAPSKFLACLAQQNSLIACSSLLKMNSLYLAPSPGGAPLDDWDFRIMSCRALWWHPT